MNIIETGIDGLILIEPVLFEDTRGYFLESYSEERYREVIGFDLHFVQDNESLSSKGVLRGIHFQKGDNAQAKLVRVLSGKVWDVAVDLRPDSPTFGKYYGVELSGENHLQFYIPRGFGHGFLVLSERTLFQYKCDNYYAPNSEGGIKWDDPDLAIEWPLRGTEPILSPKDRIHPTFSEYITFLP